MVDPGSVPVSVDQKPKCSHHLVNYYMRGTYQYKEIQIGSHILQALSSLFESLQCEGFLFLYRPSWSILGYYLLWIHVTTSVPHSCSVFFSLHFTLIFPQISLYS